MNYTIYRKHIAWINSLNNKRIFLISKSRMSSDNECGHYCNFEDGQYYTIAVKQRFAPAGSPVVAYIVQLHNGIYSDTAVRYLQRIRERVEDKPVILVGHQFAGTALAAFNATVRQLKVNKYT